MKTKKENAVESSKSAALDPEAGRALARLMVECSRKEISSGQAKDKLLKYLTASNGGKHTEAAVLQIIEKLKQDKYIDDARFAKAYTRDKLRFSKWGPEKILKGLSDAGIDRPIAEEAVEAEEELAIEVLGELLSKKQKELEKKQEKKAVEMQSRLETLQRELDEKRYIARKDTGKDIVMKDIAEECYRQKASLQRKIYALQVKLRLGKLRVKEALVAYARAKGFPSRLIERADGK